jgi:transposase
MKGQELLRALVDTRDRQVQKARIQFGNRLDAVVRGSDDAGGSKQEELLARWYERFLDLEHELDGDIRSLVRALAESEPIMGHLMALKGIGEVLAAKLVAPIEIERASTVSALWRYCGMGVVDGERERPTAGERLHYNKRLKVVVLLIAGSFMKVGSPYRRVYDSAREYYDANRPDWPVVRRHRAAMRKMAKVFLAHLWERWRTLEGLPVREPYAHDRLNHEHLYGPEEFGWPPL